MRQLITGILCAACIAAPALAQPVQPEYDGTGSQSIPLPDQKPIESDSDPIGDALKRKRNSTQSSDLFDLGSIYAQGSGGEAVNLERAYDLFEQASAKNEPRAQALLCINYLIGENRPANFAAAMRYCSKLKEKDPARMFASAYDYELGLSGPKDQAVALASHFDAAKLGNGESMNRLGVMLRDMPGKTEVARAWFRQGAMQGSASAMHNLAQMVATGQGGSEDKALAAWLYTNAARRGHAASKAWLAAQASPAILPRVQLTDPKQTLLTENVTKNGKTRIRPFSFAKAADMYPPAAVVTDTEGTATIHCYVSVTYRVEMCLPVIEFPVGFDFSNIQQMVLRGEVSASPNDVFGRPTAQTIFPVTFLWLMN
jgi:TPR repeat protein